ncbi:GNAT family N-acetyltransferase [Flavicella sp.]|uniref:GNAT family N-acetyltransferase n=1 Tax=Flavicella sp. TaxID=2957742 RepID=UPI002628DB73|nr:GNAT family N-acetyltransferase [Flavicella sp.]MDG1805870.1 GNAT family N-acetyltransferase [Flavicella sp.]
MEYKIRLGLKEDMSSVWSLIKELAVFEKEPDAVEVTVEDLEKDGFTGIPKFHVFVAELNEEIVGIALFYYRYSTWKGPTIHLEDLIVREEKRGLGIGKALYNEVMRYAFSKKVRRVEWDVLDWNTNAIDFYEKSGATMHKEWNAVKMYEKELAAYIEIIGN